MGLSLGITALRGLLEALWLSASFCLISGSAVEVSIPVVAGAFSWPDAGAGDLSVASDVDLSDLTCEVDVVGVVDGASVFGRF